MTTQISICILFFWSLQVHGQSDFGPKLTAMGENSTSVADLWNVNGNPALISFLEKPIMGLNYQRYGVEELSTQALGFVLPTNREAYGIYAQRYGTKEYQDVKASIMASKKWGDELALALRLNYHQVKITDYPGNQGFSLDVGVSYRPDQKVTLGAYWNNPFRQQYKISEVNTIIPSAFYVGVSYLISDQVMLAASVRHMFHEGFTTGIGIDYQIISCLSLAGGITLKPYHYFTGFGLRINGLKIETAIARNHFSTYAPQIGIAYAF